MMKFKTLTYSITHFIVAFAVSFILTGSVTIAGLIAVIEPLVQTVAYFLHEKAWENYKKNKDNALADKKDYKFTFSDLLNIKQS